MTDQLLARIEKLERQNKRMKAIMSGLCLFLGALLTMGQMPSQKTENSMERHSRQTVGIRNRTVHPRRLRQIHDCDERDG